MLVNQQNMYRKDGDDHMLEYMTIVIIQGC
jgi:hypothetical protein